MRRKMIRKRSTEPSWELGGLDMPVMTVRGDQHLNFTREEAAAWLDEVEVLHHAPRADDNDAVIAGVFGFVGVGVLLTLIWAAFFGSTQRPMASSASGISIQSR